jgi:hypothetical protein
MTVRDADFPQLRQIGPNLPAPRQPEPADALDAHERGTPQRMR